MAVSRLAYAVMRMTAARGLSRRERSSTASPPTPGMTMSVRMTSNSSSAIREIASSPLLAVTT